MPGTPSSLTYWPKIIAGGASVRSWARRQESRIRSAPSLLPLHAGWLEWRACKAEMSVHSGYPPATTISFTPSKPAVSWSHSFFPKPLEGAIQTTTANQMWTLPSLKPFCGLKTRSPRKGSWPQPVSQASPLTTLPLDHSTAAAPALFSSPTHPTPSRHRAFWNIGLFVPSAWDACPRCCLATTDSSFIAQLKVISSGKPALTT